MRKPSKLLSRIIAESVRGEHDAWLLDKTYPKEPSHEKAFRENDDRERMLWQIYDSAQAGTPIPEWAANAFCDALIRVVTRASTWNKEFGEVPAKGPSRRRQKYQSTIRRLAKNLIRVGEEVQNYNGPIDEEMWSILGKKLGLGRGFMKDCWSRYKVAHNR
jgi:hypothetical protein